MTGDVGVRDAPARPLSAATASFTSLGLYAGRIAGSVVGRPREIAAVQRAIANARQRMTCLVLEGEPGIGKTRVLLAAEELARAEGFRSIAVTADEEISGPFMVARSIFGSPALSELASDSPAAESVQRAVGALSNRDDPGFESIAPDARLLRVFDVAAIALRTLAADRPLMLVVDDLQWADEDSLRLLRYVARTNGQSPILIAVGIRPNEIAFVNEAVTLLADMDRMGVLERLRLARFTLVESTELLQQLLGGRVDPAGAAVMHAQAEGVPFILGEQAHAYRDAGLIQQIDGVWSLARNAERLLPNAVRTLIQRRASRLPEDTKAVLAEAAVLGRSFSLRDLHEVKAKLDGGAQEPAALAESLAPAVAMGLLAQHPDGAAADYSFSHEGVREFASATLQAPRRRAIHGAIVDLLIQDGDPPAESMPLVARHALAAGRNELCARTALEAARTALAASAPDEVLRLVEMVQPITSGAQNRVALLCLRDDALGMLRRSQQRLEGLTELAALAEALGDTHLELGVMLRRAAALRLSGEHDAAAELAQRVRELATSSGDGAAELAACLELGQALLRTDMGEGYSQTPTEGDLDGAQEAYMRAVELAEREADDSSLAAASRELGIIANSRVRVWFIGQVVAGEVPKAIGAVLAGASMHDLLPPPIAAYVDEEMAHFQKSLDIYEHLGDRRGVMSTIIAMAVGAWAPGIHLAGSPRHIEEIRRLATRVKSFTRESERALADAQMLFGVHVYSRSRGFPDVALIKGEAAWNAARAMGDRGLEFAAAGGVALQHAELAAHDEAARWLSRAAAVAAEAPTPLRALQLETWRGILASAAGDASGMREHLARAAEIATQQGRAAARCEVLSLLALEAAKLGASQHDELLLGVAERAASDAKALAAVLPGHAPWAPQADAASARVAFARGDSQAAVASARSALDTFDRAVREDLHLEIVLPAAEALLAGGTEAERGTIRDRLQLIAALIAQRILDESVRVRWFGSRVGQELMRLAGPLDPAQGALARTGDTSKFQLNSDEGVLLRALTEARTNAEIAEQLGVSAEVVAQRLATLFAKLGVSSRADATAAALTGNLV